jgi:hypothetical protein
MRPAIAAITVTVGLVATAALLSDRVPLLLGIVRNRSYAPGWFPWTLDDAAFHLAIWLGITLLASLSVRTIRARLLVGGLVAVVSPLLEYLQLQWTTTRHFEMSNAMANTKGVYPGLVVGLIVGGAIDAIEDRRGSPQAGTA